jgi:hypothetical protein
MLCFAAEFAPHLTTIFNTSITKGEVPIDWCQANVIPIPDIIPEFFLFLDSFY